MGSEHTVYPVLYLNKTNILMTLHFLYKTESLLGRDAVSLGEYLPTFRKNIMLPSSGSISIGISEHADTYTSSICGIYIHLYNF